MAIKLFGLLDLVHAYHHHDGGGGQSSPFILPRKGYIMILWFTLNVFHALQITVLHILRF